MIVFEGANPSVKVVLQIVDENGLWCLAGISALHKLLLRSLSLDSYYWGGDLVVDV